MLHSTNENLHVKPQNAVLGEHLLGEDKSTEMEPDGLSFSDNRPEAQAQRNLQEAATNSPRVQGLLQLQENVNQGGRSGQPIQMAENPGGKRRRGNNKRRRNRRNVKRGGNPRNRRSGAHWQTEGANEEMNRALAEPQVSMVPDVPETKHTEAKEPEKAVDQNQQMRTTLEESRACSEKIFVTFEEMEVQREILDAYAYAFEQCKGTLPVDDRKFLENSFAENAEGLNALHKRGGKISNKFNLLLSLEQEWHPDYGKLWGAIKVDFEQFLQKWKDFVRRLDVFIGLAGSRFKAAEAKADAKAMDAKSSAEVKPEPQVGSQSKPDVDRETARKVSTPLDNLSEKDQKIVRSPEHNDLLDDIDLALQRSGTFVGMLHDLEERLKKLKANLPQAKEPDEPNPMADFETLIALSQENTESQLQWALGCVNHCEAFLELASYHPVREKFEWLAWKQMWLQDQTRIQTLIQVVDSFEARYRKMEQRDRGDAPATDLKTGGSSPSPSPGISGAPATLQAPLASNQNPKMGQKRSTWTAEQYARKVDPERVHEGKEIAASLLGDHNLSHSELIKEIRERLPQGKLEVYQNNKVVPINIVRKKQDLHITPEQVVAYFRKYQNEIQVGRGKVLLVGEGREKNNKHYGQLFYDFNGKTIYCKHAHDHGKMF